MPKDITRSFPFKVWTGLELILFDLEPQFPSLAQVLTGRPSQVIYPAVSPRCDGDPGLPSCSTKPMDFESAI